MSYLATALLYLVALLPMKVSRSLGALVGLINLKFQTRGARVTRENLELCFPLLPAATVDELVKESLVHTGQTIMETPAAWLGNQKRMYQWIVGVEGEGLMLEALAKGKGVLIILPHVGNWEIFNVFYAVRKYRTMTALYHPPRQKWLKPVMEHIRERFGNRLVPTDRRGITQLYKALDRGEVVTILPDQVPNSGEFANLFNYAALTDPLVPRLVKKTQSIALCCVVRRVDTGFIVRFQEVDERLYDDDASVALQALNNSVEGCVGPILEQYQWEYKRYKELPPGYKRRYNYSGEPDSFH